LGIHRTLGRQVHSVTLVTLAFDRPLLAIGVTHNHELGVGIVLQCAGIVIQDRLGFVVHAPRDVLLVPALYELNRRPRTHLRRWRRYLGCASHPWRTPDARLRRVGNHHFPLDETSAQGPSTRQALAGLSAQSSGSYRCHGFLHRPHSHLWGSVLLLHHQPRSPPHPALQCHSPSHQHLDRAAVARSFSLRFRAQISPIRPRCEVRIGSASVDPLAEDDTGPYLDSESLAKWGRRALGRKLPPRLARPRNRVG